MAYCNQDDLVKMVPLIELAELTAEAGDIPDNAVVEEAVRKADAEIDSYLGKVYEVPFSPVPASIKSMSVDLAIYHLYSRRNVMPPVRRQKYEAALALLRELAAGGAVIETMAGQAQPTVTEVAGFLGSPRLFSRQTLGDW